MRNVLQIVVWISVLLNTVRLFAATPPPRLVADLGGPLQSSTGTELLAGLPTAEGLVFALWRFDSGLEIWGTPNTTTRARRLIDVCPLTEPSTFSTSFSPLLLARAGQVYFRAPCGQTSALWATDGTLFGTRLLDAKFEVRGTSAGVGIVPGTGEALIFGSREGVAGLWAFGAPGQAPRRVATVNQLADEFVPRSGPLSAPSRHGLVFGARMGLENGDIWVSDGTPEGTRKLVQLPEPFGKNPFGFVSLGSRVLFWAGTATLDLWSTDGTSQGTERLVAAAGSGRSSAGPILTGATRTFVHGAHCWVTDGTLRGTQSTSFCAQVVWHDRAVFARDGQLWRSDGTDAGTTVLAGFPTGDWTARFVSPHLGLVAERRSPSSPAELWLLSAPGGTPRRLFVGASDFLAFFGEGGGGLFFGDFVPAEVDDEVRIWRSDGTPPVVVGQGLPVNTEDSSFRGFSVFTEGAWWVTAVDPTDSRVFRFAEDALEMAAQPRRDLSSNPGQLEANAPSLFVVTLHRSLGDPTLFQVQAQDVTERFHSNRGFVFGYHLLDDRVVYWTEQGPFDLWLLDDAGSHSLYRTRALGYESGFQTPPFANSAQGLLFVDSDGLYRVDPVAERVELVKSFTAGRGSQAPYFAGDKGEVFFFHRLDHGLNQGQLWRTDGTPEGTQARAEVAGIELAAGLERLFWFGDDLRFWSVPRAGGTPLQLEAGSIPRALGRLVPVGTRTCIVFPRAGLWSSDGSEAGTRRLRETVPPWRSNSSFSPLVAVNFDDRCYFVSDDPDTGHELWSSDGTVAGTRLVADLWPGPASSFPDGLTVIGDRLLFRASDGVHGTELWATDGTATGTRRITDLAPGTAASDPADFTVWGGELAFTATDAGEIGREVWALPLTALADGEAAQPAAPVGEWLTSPEVSGFRFKVRISGSTAGQLEGACLAETACVSGAVAGRPEVFLRVVGPKPNGFLWPTLVKFSTSEVEVWIEHVGLGTLRYYRLAGARPGFDELPALFDREGFWPAPGSVAGAFEPTGGAESPPDPGWVTTPAIPGFRFAVTLAGAPTRQEASCLAETLCVSGAIAGRSEVFVRIVGPKPNGFLWPTLARFTTSEVEVLIEQIATGARQTYRLPGAAPGRDVLTGLFDREGFTP